jgi:hypothetical protein
MADNCPAQTCFERGLFSITIVRLLPNVIMPSYRAFLSLDLTAELSFTIFSSVINTDIQGSPGTGKSHTITALLLSAIFLKKRVLMVSHKKPAVARADKNGDIFRRAVQELRHLCSEQPGRQIFRRPRRHRRLCQFGYADDGR